MKFFVQRAALAGALFLFSCSPNSSSENEIVNNLKDNIGCSDFNNQVFDQMDAFLIKEKRPPQLKDLIKKISELTESEKITEEEGKIWKDIFRTLLEKGPAAEKLSTPRDYRTLFAALELGDKSTSERKTLSALLESQFSKMSAISQTCLKPTPPETFPSPSSDEFERRIINHSEARSFLGMEWSFATAYQSCGAIRKPAMTTLSPKVEGIKIIGDHPQGGKKRMIEDLNKVLSTHYYYEGESPTPQCFNFLQSPLIYDFGGKPNPISAATLDFFAEGGNGTTVLGTDCSGLIFSALATAGLRLKSNLPLESRTVLTVGSVNYLDLSIQNLDCLDYISVDGSETIHSGDIAAINGHVVMVGKLGEDPLGIKNVPLKSFCDLLTTTNFDFEILQSSPSNNGIGINRYMASDYLQSASNNMKNGFLNYAKQACRAKFEKKPVNPKTPSFAIVRHKGTEACRSPRITLARESCISSCPELFE